MLTIPQAVARMGVSRSHFFALRRVDPTFPQPQLAELNGKWRIAFDPTQIDAYNALRKGRNHG